MGKAEAKSADAAWQFQRRFTIPSMGPEVDAQAVRSALAAQKGVREVRVWPERKRLDVRYCATETSYARVRQWLLEQGLQPKNSWWQRMKAACYEFVEDNARENAKAPPPACCNKPPRR